MAIAGRQAEMCAAPLKSYEWVAQERENAERGRCAIWMALARSFSRWLMPWCVWHCRCRAVRNAKYCEEHTHTLPRAFSSLTQLTAQMYTQYGAGTRDRVYLHCDVWKVVMISFWSALKFNAAVFCNGVQSNVQTIQNQGLVKISHVLRLKNICMQTFKWKQSKKMQLR